MLVARFKNSLGKSSYGGQPLYEHAMAATRIAHAILTDCRFTPVNFSKQKRELLLFATFVHDVAKLDPSFQAMLRAARDNLPLPPKRVKHEASTLDFEEFLRQSEEEARTHLSDVLSYDFEHIIKLDEVLAFAITHHGLFYLSFETRDGQDVPLKRIRREWTVFNYGEQRRVTLADLLFDYHPLGGLVIIADLLSSFCHEQRIKDTNEIISRANSFHDLVDLMLREGAVERVENSISQYDPRTYGLRDLLILLAGGLA